MSVGLVLKDPSCRLVAEVAPIADARGFSHLLFTELSIPDVGPITGRDPFVLASIALGASEQLRSGTAVTGTPFHTPRHMALRAATLQEQSGGRFVLGCGVAHKEFADLLGVAYPSAPVAHARAYCDELRSISDTLAFGAGLTVWLAALGDKMAATGAAHADGIILNWVSPDWTRRTVQQVRQATGISPTVAVLLRVARGDALARAAQKYMTTLPSYASHFARQGLDSPVTVSAATPEDPPTTRPGSPPASRRTAMRAPTWSVCTRPTWTTSRSSTLSRPPRPSERGLVLDLLIDGATVARFVDTRW